MQVIENAPAPLSTHNILRNVKIDAADKQAIASAQKRVDELMAIIANSEPDRHGRISALHVSADQAEQVLLADCTQENAELLHAALVRLETAKLSFGRIDSCCNVALADASRTVEPIAMKTLDAGIASLDTEASKTRAALVKTATVFSDDGETALFDKRLAVTRATLESERTEARRDPLHWLRVNGFAD